GRTWRLVAGIRRPRGLRRAVAIGILVIDVVRRGGRGTILRVRVLAAASTAAATTALAGARGVRRRRGSFTAGDSILDRLGDFDVRTRCGCRLHGGRTQCLLLGRSRGFAARGRGFRVQYAGLRGRLRRCRFLRRACLPLRVVVARLVLLG